MWKSTEYCTFHLNWDCSHDPSYLVSYSITQNLESDDWISNIPEVLPSSPYLHCETTDVTKSPPELRTTCKPYNEVGIFGIDVVSEARIIEVYSDLDGYLTSSKGELCDDVKLDNAENSCELFCCRVKFEDPVNSISIKFLGLGNKSSFRVHRLHVALVQSQGLATGQNEMGIDLNKVKGYLHSMGDVMSDNARDLLTSVEQYQQTQMLGMSSLQNLFSGSRSYSGQGHSGGQGQLNGLLSILTKFSSAGMATPGTHNKVSLNETGTHSPAVTETCKPTKNETHLQGQETNTEQLDEADQNSEKKHADKADSVEKYKVKELSPLERLLQKPLTSQGHIMKDPVSEDQDDIYKMLQGICGSVSSMRIKPQREEPVKTQEQIETRPENKQDKSEPSQSTVTPMTSELLDTVKVIQQTVLQEVHDTEQRIKDYVDTSLAAMETRLGAKLDSILQLLNKADTCDISNDISDG